MPVATFRPAARTRVARHGSVGIRDPFDVGIKHGNGTVSTSQLHPSQQKIVKKIFLHNNEGVATSGTYIRGRHIYNPKATSAGGKDALDQPIPVLASDEIVSLTVIGPNVYEADRFATAAFAMGRAGIEFVERLHLPAGGARQQ